MLVDRFQRMEAPVSGGDDSAGPGVIHVWHRLELIRKTCQPSFSVAAAVEGLRLGLRSDGSGGLEKNGRTDRRPNAGVVGRFELDFLLQGSRGPGFGSGRLDLPRDAVVVPQPVRDACLHRGSRLKVRWMRGKPRRGAVRMVLQLPAERAGLRLTKSHTYALSHSRLRFPRASRPGWPGSAARAPAGHSSPRRLRVRMRADGVPRVDDGCPDVGCLTVRRLRYRSRTVAANTASASPSAGRSVVRSCRCGAATWSHRHSAASPGGPP